MEKSLFYIETKCITFTNNNKNHHKSGNNCNKNNADAHLSIHVLARR